MAELFAALKAIPAILEAIKLLGVEIRAMRDAITQKNIAELKTEVNSSLMKIKNTKNKDELAVLIEELSKKVSK